MRGMDAETIGLIGVPVGAICKFLVAAGLQGRWASLGAIPVTILCLWLYGVSHAGVTLTPWDYLVGGSTVLLTAAGIFHASEETVKAVKADGMVGAAVRKLTGDEKP